MQTIRQALPSLRAGRAFLRYSTLSTLAALAGLPETASPSTSPTGTSARTAIVLAVHAEESTAGFYTALGLAPRNSPGGRFAAVKLVNGAWGEGSYTLVFVPRNVPVAVSDTVEVKGDDLLGHPGEGVVTRVVPAR